MTEVIQQLSIIANRTRVFKIAQDYDLRLEWDPFLQDIRFISEDTSLQRGLKVWVKSYNGMEMSVEYLNYQEPSHVSMRMIDGPWIFQDFSGLWKFESPKNKNTLVTFKYKFNLKWYLWLGRFLVRRILSRDMKKRLEALKSACEEDHFGT